MAYVVDILHLHGEYMSCCWPVSFPALKATYSDETNDGQNHHANNYHHYEYGATESNYVKLARIRWWRSRRARRRWQEGILGKRRSSGVWPSTIGALGVLSSMEGLFGVHVGGIRMGENAVKNRTGDNGVYAGVTLSRGRKTAPMVVLRDTGIKAIWLSESL